jgi:F0F1-type ATP synthase delta subunit
MNEQQFKLPNRVISQTDINRLLRELDALNDFFMAAAVRSAGTPLKPPKITFMLEQTARENKYNLLEDSRRRDLTNRLKAISQSAPILHISFASEPPQAVIEKIVNWLRSNIHPYALVVIGLQPTIAAGCVLRTANRVFDMSLRSHLQKQEEYLIRLIRGAVSGKR